MVLYNGKNIVGGVFPNGEKYYTPIGKLITANESTIFTLIFESVEDIFDLLIYKKYYDDTFTMHNNASLVANFCPFGQADRAFFDKMFTFKYFARLINDANFRTVYIFDPHSRVMAAALDRCRVLDAYPEEFTDEEVKYDFYCYPDEGAIGKYTEYLDMPYIYGIKQRDLISGKIISYKLNVENLKGKKVLIVDDICMGGTTFKKCAGLLRDAGAERVDLYISHLMKQAEEFYRCHKDFGIDNFYSANTLKLPWFNN